MPVICWNRRLYDRGGQVRTLRLRTERATSPPLPISFFTQWGEGRGEGQPLARTQSDRNTDHI